MTSEPPRSEPFQRLHATSLMFSLAGHARGLLLPGILVLIFARRDRWQTWLMALFVISLVYETYRYFTLRYCIADRQIILRHGLVFRNERHIPFDRIQSIDLAQNPVHRWFGVANVRIETAGGASSEAQLKVLSIAAIESMRRHVFADRTHADASVGIGHEDEESGSDDPVEGDAGQVTAPAPASERPADEVVPVADVPLVELVKLGLVSNRGAALILAVLGLAWEFDLFEKVEGLARYVSVLKSAPTIYFVGFVCFVTGGVIAMLVLFSIITTIIRLYNFRLERVDDDVRVSCGLFTRLSATVPRRRVQVVSIQQSVPMRWFSRFAVKIETAGGYNEDDSTLSQKWFIPIASREQLDYAFGALGLDFQTSDHQWLPLAPGARWRMIKKAVISTSLLCLLVAAVFRPWGLVSFPILIPFAVFMACAEAKYAAYALPVGGIAYRSGVWIRRISISSHKKIHAVSVRESPFDRRYGMAAVGIDTAGAGPTGHRILVPYLSRQTADELAVELGEAAQRAGFEW